MINRQLHVLHRMLLDCGCVPQPVSLLLDPKTLHLDTSSLGMHLKNILTPWNSSEKRGEYGTPVLSLSVDSRTEKEANRRVSGRGLS